jgi:hypothetical protein
MPPEPAEREIISLLLDAYERSSFFKTGAAPTRRMRIRLYDSGISSYPRYNIENPEARREINRAALHLAEKNLVAVRWMKGEENHLIAQIALNTETPAAIMAAYAFLGRKPKNTQAGEISAGIHALLENIESPWIRRFLEDCDENLAKNRSLTGGKTAAGKLSPDDEERENLFRALRFIDTRRDKEELLERVFSIRCFGNSKTFETAIKKRLLEILRRYTGEDDSTDEELLAFAGIVRYPEHFEFRGPLTLRFDDDNGGYIDFSPLRYGASLSTLDFARGRLELPVHLDRILSIENKANYTSHIRQNPGTTELTVYHGGQYSPSRGRFFRALAAAMPENCAWYHFGDIDYGGFSMLARLRREIHPDIQPFRMDKAELVKYAALTRPITPSYAAKLQTLSAHQELADCQPCLAHMLQNRVRLEQEALLEDQDSRIA